MSEHNLQKVTEKSTKLASDLTALIFTRIWRVLISNPDDNILQSICQQHTRGTIR